MNGFAGLPVICSAKCWIRRHELKVLSSKMKQLKVQSSKLKDETAES